MVAKSATSKAVDLIKHLPPEERILVVQEIWDSIAADAQPDAGLEAEIDRRCALIDRDPTRLRPWVEVRQRLEAAASRTRARSRRPKRP